MNAGCLRPINIVIPDNSMLRRTTPRLSSPATSRFRSSSPTTLFGALGAMSGAQGTMNNVNFGNDTYQYYETICSGSPAGPGFPGTDAVHTHMTNTRLTDPEVLEFRYPVMLEDFHIRKGSGGKGKWSAGDGIRRTMRFLEKMEYTILSGHRASGRSGWPAARRPDRRELRAKEGRHDGPPQGRRRHRGRCRRGDHHPDAHRGWIWQDRAVAFGLCRCAAAV
jgi:5-oxoprolinase (ATP-hydrolysing)